MGISLATNLGVGVTVMELVRRDSLKKPIGILVVLMSSFINIIISPGILLYAPYVEPSDRLGAGDSAVVMLAVTLVFGTASFVAFSIGVLCTRARGDAGGRSVA
jgi:hypothetical protein